MWQSAASNLARISDDVFQVALARYRLDGKLGAATARRFAAGFYFAVRRVAHLIYI